MSRLVRLSWFVAVGCTAAALHFGTVVQLVETLGWVPLLANVAGWLLAFVVSFLGQWLLTFRGRGATWMHALPRFFAISLAGFLANESAYALLLRFSALRYDVLLAGVLVGVAVTTYLLSSRWAFRGSPAG
ncbi:GtrA family protein [Ramlibacter tataouinensis]|uniref:GtrA family protein n=1 Tax=Ramlibacter tataouinensis TaxID=94132 RepID=UPI0011AEBAD2|nr:GtrA family protein [Ramlibacter tataouinensis]